MMHKLSNFSKIETKKMLTLKSNVFLWINEYEGLLYNSESYQHFLFKLTPSIKKICIQLSNIDNMYSIELTGNDIELDWFIEKLINMGFAINSENGEEIVSFPPILNLQKNWEKISMEGTQEISEVINYLSNVTIYMGNGNADDENLFLQTEYPVNDDKIINFDELDIFLNKLLKTNVKTVQFVVSNLRCYPNIKNLLSLISLFGKRAIIYIKEQEILDDISKKVIDESGIKTILLYRSLKNIDKFCNANHYHHRFLIDNENDFNILSQYINEKRITRFEITPIFNGSNKDFIFRYVFLNKEDVLGSTLDKRHIFMHQVLNVFSFGHLYVLPSGDVYSDLNKNAIGNIKDDVHSLIIEELNINNSWRRTRKLSGCYNCVLTDMCPSPSIIENIICSKCICIDSL